MCLYGHDLDEGVSPVEAGLTWVVGKDRRVLDGPRTFPGASRILEEIKNGPSRRRVGFEVIGSPAREGCKIYDQAGTLEIGTLPSISQPAREEKRRGGARLMHRRDNLGYTLAYARN